LGAQENKTMMAKQRNYGHGGHDYNRPPSNESVLHSEKIQIERKTFLFTLKENPRGRFLRITEDVGGRRDSIIIPSTGLKEFAKTLSVVVKACPDDHPEPGTDTPLEA
jgi:hypothetical protein